MVGCNEACAGGRRQPPLRGRNRGSTHHQPAFTAHHQPAFAEVTSACLPGVESGSAVCDPEVASTFPTSVARTGDVSPLFDGFSPPPLHFVVDLLTVKPAELDVRGQLPPIVGLRVVCSIRMTLDTPGYRLRRPGDSTVMRASIFRVRQLIEGMQHCRKDRRNSRHGHARPQTLAAPKSMLNADRRDRPVRGPVLADRTSSPGRQASSMPPALTTWGCSRVGVRVHARGQGLDVHQGVGADPGDERAVSAPCSLSLSTDTHGTSPVPGPASSRSRSG